MSRSHWRAIIATIGLALAATAYAQPVGDDAGEKAGTEEAQSPPAENAEPTERPTIHDLIERIATALDSDDDEAEAKRQREQAARDLQAQEDMAKWAKYMLWATCAGVAVTFAGVVLVYFTLRYTRAAAIHAQSAADAAWQTVSEARSATVTTRRAATSVNSNTMRELRAYISVEPAGIIKQTGSNETLGHVIVRNVGKLPASKVTVHVQMETGDRDKSDFPIKAREDHSADRVIQPNADMRQGSVRGSHLVDFDQWAGFVFVWGVVYYVDGYDRPRQTKFCHRYNLEARNPPAMDDLFGGKGFCLIDREKARYNEIGNDAD